jgi:HNH endonuclease
MTDDRRKVDHSAEAFWTQVDKANGPSSCWPWMGKTNKRGHGQTSWVVPYEYAADRTAWILMNGPIMQGLAVKHTCMNPRCCNPAHLELRTNADATRADHAAGRHLHQYQRRRVDPGNAQESRTKVAS